MNATSLGMAEGDPLPLDPAGIAPGAVVAEVLVKDTPLLEAARSRNATAHPGLPMLEQQFELMIEFLLS
ncbi:MAG: hypothetical protein JO048_05535 [Methylobacteriaceae bacterium]|nr:hypothetical protein [Methylobacteriaceae bacterium]